MYHDPDEYLKDIKEQEKARKRAEREAKKRERMMWDPQILSRVYCAHEPGRGPNGFELKFAAPEPFPPYDEGLLLDSITGYFDDLPWPFKKKIVILAEVISKDTRYRLSFQKESREPCTESQFINIYLDRFLSELRLYTLGITKSRSEMGEGFIAYEDPNTQYKELFEVEDD